MNSKPYVIEYKFKPCVSPLFPWMKEWRKWRQYKTEKRRQQALAVLPHNNTFAEFRLKQEKPSKGEPE